MTGPGLGSPFGPSLLGGLGGFQDAQRQQSDFMSQALQQGGIINRFVDCSSTDSAALRIEAISADEFYKGPETVREELQRDTDRWLN